jgi:serine/threonine-protein kinase PpkA
VVVTDASAREGGSALASTGLSTEQVRLQAQERGVALLAVHLRTPEGRKDHAAAEAQYRRLATWPGRPPLYFPIEAGDPARFEDSIGRLAKALVEQVREPGRSGAGANTAGERTSIEAGVADVGRAMVLAYLGRQQEVRAPPMYEAWVGQRDLRHPDVSALSVRVLLTKNQLSDLQTTLRRVVEAGERSQLDPTDFFNQIRSAAVAMGRGSVQVGQGKVRNLEQAGLMGEYLDGLPYQSNFMSLDQDTWTRMQLGQQQALLDDLKSKIALYQRFHDNVDRWVKINPAAGDGERVYPVPIDSLP